MHHLKIKLMVELLSPKKQMAGRDLHLGSSTAPIAQAEILIKSKLEGVWRHVSRGREHLHSK
jgi:hypothetical protein